MAKVYDVDGRVIGSAYGLDGTSLPIVYKHDGSELPFNIFNASAIVTALTYLDNVSGNKQGACTDGTYIYQILIGSSFSFVKYKISDGTYTITSVGSSIPYNHGNDMAYNPNNGHIYVAAMSSDGAVMELDTDFNYIATHYLVKPDGTPYAVWALCYNQKTREFFSLTSGPSVAVYDESFNYVRSIPMPDNPDATAQGMETDGDYIYRVWYQPNKIDVSTIIGTYVTTISNPMSGEPEDMMYDWIHDKYYMNKNSSTDMFYEVGIKK